MPKLYKSCDNHLSLEPVILYHAENDWDVIRYILAFHDCDWMLMNEQTDAHRDPDVCLSFTRVIIIIYL